MKPSNFILGYDDQRRTVLKVADFGIARNLRHEMVETHRIRYSGTPGYMSPEQIRGELLTPASDLYSLGCVFYELLLGRPVFPEARTDEQNEYHLRQEPIPIRSLRFHIPQEIEELLKCLLAKDPRKRPSSAKQVKQYIDQLIRGVRHDPK